VVRHSGKDTKQSEALQGWGDMRLRQLDGWLENRKFIATADFTVADILMTHVLDAGTRQEMLKPYPNLLKYRAECTERPAWKRTVAAYSERVEPA
jgi:glutathione S-transferase